MTPAVVKSRVLAKLNISSSDFSDILTTANVILSEIGSAISVAKGELMGTYSYDDLVADQREYDLPDDILNNVKAVFLMLDGSYYVRAKIVDLNDPLIFGNISKKTVFQESWITANFSNDEPYVAFYRGSMFVFSGSITAVTNGIQLWYSYPFDDIPNIDEASIDLATATDNTQSIKTGLSKQFHDILVRGICKDKRETDELPLRDYEKLYEAKLQQAVSNLKGQEKDREIFASVPSDTGEEY